MIRINLVESLSCAACPARVRQPGLKSIRFRLGSRFRRLLVEKPCVKSKRLASKVEAPTYATTADDGSSLEMCLSP